MGASKIALFLRKLYLKTWGGSTLEKDYHYVVTPYSDIIVKMQDDAELKQASDEADLILTDGQI